MCSRVRTNAHVTQQPKVPFIFHNFRTKNTNFFWKKKSRHGREKRSITNNVVENSPIHDSWPTSTARTTDNRCESVFSSLSHSCKHQIEILRSPDAKRKIRFLVDMWNFKQQPSLKILKCIIVFWSHSERIKRWDSLRRQNSEGASQPSQERKWSCSKNISSQ